MWAALKRQFASSSQSRLMQLRFQLQSIKKGSLSISDYLDKIKEIADQLAAASKPIPLADLTTLYTLGGLGAEYEPFVMSVTSRTDPIDFDKLHGLLITQEHRLALASQLSSLDLNASPTANIAIDLICPLLLCAIVTLLPKFPLVALLVVEDADVTAVLGGRITPLVRSAANMAIRLRDALTALIIIFSPRCRRFSLSTILTLLSRWVLLLYMLPPHWQAVLVLLGKPRGIPILEQVITWHPTYRHSLILLLILVLIK